MHVKKCLECGEDTKGGARGLCRKHYVEYREIVGTSKIRCTKQGCKKPLFARGMCRSHYYQFKRTQGLGNFCSICGQRAYYKTLCRRCYDKKRLKGEIKDVHCLKCLRPATARGLCRKHYEQFRREIGNGSYCSICGEPVNARGLCLKHYKEARERNFDIVKKEVTVYNKLCDRCDEPVYALGLCPTHYLEYKKEMGKKICSKCFRLSYNNTGLCEAHYLQYKGDASNGKNKNREKNQLSR